MLKLRSVSSIVIPPAKTGKERRRRKAVISIDQTKRGNLCIVMPGPLMLNMVVIKLIDDNMELIPERWRLNIAKSTAPPEWLAMLLKGGYIVHPVPAPTSTNAELNRRRREGGRSQKLMLFSLGNDMSGAPINMGTNQFPNPPIIAGITIKKIIRKA